MYSDSPWWQAKRPLSTNNNAIKQINLIMKSLSLKGEFKPSRRAPKLHMGNLCRVSNDTQIAEGKGTLERLSLPWLE